jgi:hypothetical protein
MPEKKPNQKKPDIPKISPGGILVNLISFGISSSDVPWTFSPKPTPSEKETVYMESFFNPWRPPSSPQSGLVDPYRPTELRDRLWVPDDVGAGRILRNKDVFDLFRVWATESPEYPLIEKRITELSSQILENMSRSASARRDVETVDRLVEAFGPAKRIYPPLRKLREYAKGRVVKEIRDRADREMEDANNEWNRLEEEAINLFAQWVLNHSNPDVRARVVRAIEKEYGKDVDLSMIDSPWRGILEKYREETGRKPQRKSNPSSRSNKR